MNRVGEVLDGKYEVTRLLGRGGMGEVYVARHRLIGKDVAIKFLRRDHATQDDAVARFAQEARAAAAVGHRGIVDIYDLGTSQDGAPYLVMELIDGDSLRLILARHGKLSPAQAAAVGVELLSPLVASHAKGVVHRDLKPDNVMLERTEGHLAVKLLDFGIAKMTEGGSQLTQSGFPLGTAQYMSPEQARGQRDLDARVDVWAVGVILYEALTGRSPFQADNYNALIMEVLRAEVPPPRSLEPAVPAELEAVVMRAMERDRDRRFASAAALQAALRPFARPLDARELLTPLGDTAPAGVVSPVAPTLAAVVRSSAPPVDTSARPGFRLRRSALLGAFAMIGIAVAWYGLPGPRAPHRPNYARPARAAEGHRPARPVPREALVTIRLEGVPEGGRVFLDGARVLDLPIQIAPRPTMISLRVEADGFEPSLQMVKPDRDRTIQVALTPRAAPPNGSARRPRGTKQPGARGSAIQTDTREFEE